MNVTDNYGLKKPERGEYVNVDDINFNSDIIDEELYKKINRQEVIDADYMPKSGGTFTGDVRAKTEASGDKSTKLATTAFVSGAVGEDRYNFCADLNNPLCDSVFCNGTTLHTPYKEGLTTNLEGRCISIKKGTTDYSTQLYIANSSDNHPVLYFRGKKTGNWSE